MPRKSKTDIAKEDAAPLSGTEADDAPFGNDEPDIAAFRPDREGTRKVLGDLEADIMDYVWDHSSPTGTGVTVRDVYEDFRLQRMIAYTTVMNTMGRLARKKVLRFQKIDTAYVYSPSMTREEFIDNFVSRILENLLVSFADTTETHLKRLATADNAQRIAHLRARITDVRRTVTDAGPEEG